ncbi:asparaginase [Terasakiella sp. SH-1]|uniref:asparaginase n=1 Tax=Terasakiella sp. SH-1 TaxID=2560057 RepID=UPI001980EC03|nr:asparaginase [Terasakiella sp. SH-1]
MNPVLVEVTRGDTVESRHSGAFCVSNGAGDILLSQGDIDQPVFPRSSIKAIQALAMMESGAADAFGFSDEELALACASHGGEVAHTGVAQSMLNKMGLTKELLQCGSHWPMNEEAGRALAMEGETPNPLHNNCSGKHSGFLAYLKHMKVTPRGYTQIDHPLQQAIKKALEEVCETDLSNAPVGIDGCDIPTWAIPLKNLALGFAKYSDPVTYFTPERAKAVTRLNKAIFTYPYMVAGKDRYDTSLMEAFPSQVFAKVGAEGVFTAFIPKRDIGIAVKCDDGAFRGAEHILTAVLEDLKIFSKDDFDKAGIAHLYATPLLNRNGKVVGEVRRAF